MNGACKSWHLKIDRKHFFNLRMREKDSTESKWQGWRRVREAERKRTDFPAAKLGSSFTPYYLRDVPTKALRGWLHPWWWSLLLWTVCVHVCLLWSLDFISLLTCVNKEYLPSVQKGVCGQRRSSRISVTRGSSILLNSVFVCVFTDQWSQRTLVFLLPLIHFLCCVSLPSFVIFRYIFLLFVVSLFRGNDSCLSCYQSLFLLFDCHVLLKERQPPSLSLSKSILYFFSWRSSSLVFFTCSVLSFVDWLFER